MAFVFYTLVALTGLSLAYAFAQSVRHAGDPINPVVFLCPLLGYVYFYRPLTASLNGDLQPFFSGMPQLVHAQAVILACVVLLFLGIKRYFPRPPYRHSGGRGAGPLSQRSRRDCLRTGVTLGFLSTASFYYLIVQSGGFARVYGSAKGYAGAASGYLFEAPLLAFPAIIFLALAWRGSRIGIKRGALVLLVASPHLVQGLIGTRRGPIFMITITIILFLYITSDKAIKIRHTVAAVVFAGLLVVSVYSFRQYVYLGSDYDIDFGMVVDEVGGGNLNQMDAYIYNAGLIAASRDNERHFWGVRFFVQIFVRPIPRQLWPEKYSYFGMDWMDNLRGDMTHGLLWDEWYAAVGWTPFPGSTPGFTGDTYLEFSYLSFLFAYLLGMFYGRVWMAHRRGGVVWTVVYAICLILTVYLPTQGFADAWAYRLLFMSAISGLVWFMYAGYLLEQPHKARVQVRRVVVG